MAQFTTSLPDPSTTGLAGGGPTRLSPSGIGEIANLASTGISLFSQSQQLQKSKQEEADKAAAFGRVQTEIIDLEDERFRDVHRAQQIGIDIQNIQKDGITPEEAEQMKFLERERDKLSAARREGVLNPNVFQTRLNALHKKALADVSNQSILPQIGALFGQGRSRITDPAGGRNAQQKQAMDNLYGEGNWTQADVGYERGKNLLQTQLINDATQDVRTVKDDLSLGLASTLDVEIRRLQNTIFETGALPSDADLDGYRAAVSNSIRGMHDQIDQAVVQNRRNGTPVNPEEVQAMKAEVSAQSDLYLSFMDDNQILGSQVKLSSRLKELNEVVTQSIKTRNPALLTMGAGVAGGGNSVDSLLSIANAPDSILESTVGVDDPQFTGRSGKEIKAEASRLIRLAVEGEDLTALANQGLINKSLLRFVTGQSLGKTKNPKELNAYVSALEDTDVEDIDGVLDLLSDPKTSSNIKNNADKETRLGPVITRQITNLTNFMDDGHLKKLKITEDGSLEIGEGGSTSPFRGDVGYQRDRTRVNKQLKKLHKVVNLYPDMFDGSGYVEELMNLRQELLDEDVEKPSETISPFKGGEVKSRGQAGRQRRRVDDEQGGE